MTNWYDGIAKVLTSKPFAGFTMGITPLVVFLVAFICYQNGVQISIAEFKEYNGGIPEGITIPSLFVGAGVIAQSAWIVLSLLWRVIDNVKGDNKLAEYMADILVGAAVYAWSEVTFKAGWLIQNDATHAIQRTATQYDLGQIKDQHTLWMVAWLIIAVSASIYVGYHAVKSKETT